MAAADSGVREGLRGYEGNATDSNLPIPDPTRLTTQLVDRTMTAFRELFEARLTEMNKAVVLATQQMSKIPVDAAAERDELRADVDRQVLALREFIMSQIENIREVNKEKFEAINSRFLERDTRTELSAAESRSSLAAALAAAKEAAFEQNKSNAQAVSKSEVATQKQIDAMTLLMAASNKSLEDKIADVKTRLDRAEGQSAGSAEARIEKQFDIGAIIQMIATMATIIGLVIVAFHK